MLLSLATYQQGAVSLHLCSTNYGLPSSSRAKESLTPPPTLSRNLAQPSGMKALVHARAVSALDLPALWGFSTSHQSLFPPGTMVGWGSPNCQGPVVVSGKVPTPLVSDA